METCTASIFFLREQEAWSDSPGLVYPLEHAQLTELVLPSAGEEVPGRLKTTSGNRSVQTRSLPASLDLNQSLADLGSKAQNCATWHGRVLLPRTLPPAWQLFLSVLILP